MPLAFLRSESDLKNDAQRKARRFEVLLVNQEYQKSMDTQYAGVLR